MANLFTKLLNNLTRSNKKRHNRTARGTFNGAANSARNIVDILSSSDVAAMDVAMKAGIKADDVFTVSNGTETREENVATFAAKMLHQRLDEMNAASAKILTAHGESFAAIDRIREHSMHPQFGGKYASAAAMIHSQEFLQHFNIPQDKQPQFTFSKASLQGIVADGQQVKNNHAQFVNSVHIVSHLAGVENVYDEQAIHTNLANLPANKNGEKAAGIYADFITSNVSATQHSALDHITIAEQLDAMHQQANGFDLDKAMEWANDPYLQYHYRFLGDLPGATKYDDAFFAMFEKTLEAEKQQEMQQQQELQQQALAKQNALQHYHNLRSVIAQRSFEEHVDAPTHNALQYVDDINDFEAANKTLMLGHETVLYCIGGDIEGSNTYVSAASALNIAKVQEEIRQSEIALREAFDIDENISLHDGLAQLAEHDAESKQALEVVTQADRNFAEWDNRYLFDMLVKAEYNARVFLQLPEDQIADHIIDFSQDQDIVAKMPYIAEAAAELHKMRAEPEAPQADMPEPEAEAKIAVDAAAETVEAITTEEKSEVAIASVAQEQPDLDEAAMDVLRNISVCLESPVDEMKEQKIEMCHPVSFENGVVPLRVKMPAA